MGWAELLKAVRWIKDVIIVLSRRCTVLSRERDIICENDIKAYTIQEVLKECSLSFKLSELLR